MYARVFARHSRSTRLARAAISRSRIAALAAATLVLAITAAILGWTYSRRPPNCTDPRTLALVRRDLARVFGTAPALTRITTVAGSAFAIRFVCTADFANPMRLRSRTLVDSIRYTSRFGPQRHTQRVAVEIEPVLRWFRVQ